jgi:transcription elongation factor GreA
MRVPTRKSEVWRESQLKNDPYLTPAKIQAMERELERLVKHDRRPAADEVARTAQMGDLSENAAYQFAKQNLRRINARILTLEDRLKHAIPIDQSQIDGKIRIGSSVELLANGKRVDYEILGSAESNPFKNKISYSSPLGQLLIGKSAGETVELKTTTGTTTYNIVSVS